MQDEIHRSSVTEKESGTYRTTFNLGASKNTYIWVFARSSMTNRAEF
jgi:hypothetical protein